MKTVYVPDKLAWRQWLLAHHQSETEIWLVYYKKHTGKPRVSYDDAVCEALCFGWIDSIVRRIDDDSFAQKFTPRRADSAWSNLNVERVKRLMAEGLMAAAGQALVPPDLLERSPVVRATAWPPQLEQALRAHPQAWAAFTRLAPSHQRNYIRWVSEAKQEETRQRRLQQAIEKLLAGATLGMK